MKKYIQYSIVLILVLTVVGVAKGGSAWASAFSNLSEAAEQTSHIILRDPADFSSQPASISITGSGTYNIGGFCNLEVLYKLNSGLKDEADVEVPTDFSAPIPFGYEGELYLPGCHIVHYKNNEIMEEMSTDDGTWEVCFAERPNVELTIYYYQDEPFEDDPIWIELDTSHENGLACAFAPYTGEYAPGSKEEAELEFIPITGEIRIPGEAGTVVTPPEALEITETGVFSVGGICTLLVIYSEPAQTNEIHVADSLNYETDPVDDYNVTEYDPFPDSEALLYQPGCHVLHYTFGEITRFEKFPPQGEWEICFAALPDKEMTIYNYLGDLTDQESSWVALPTTVSNGRACAPAFYTGVYVPTGK